MQALPEATDRDWVRLNERVSALEVRVHALEQPGESAESAIAPVTTVPAPQPAPANATARTGGFFPVLGKALLGIAGAYLLRALAESHAFPQIIVAVVAILFAIFWIIWAQRAEKTDKLAGAIYAGTSALIFAPMLWELTLSFRLLNTIAAASVLALYGAIAFALTWRRQNSPVGWIGNFTATALSVALAFAAHSPAPFLVALMLFAAICEFAAVKTGATAQRVLNAGAIDFALWATLFIYAGAEANHIEYAVLSSRALVFLSLVPLLIYIVSVLVKTALLAKRILLLECAQLVAAFVLAATGLLQFGGAPGKVVLGGLCIGFALLSYALAFTRFDKDKDRRNMHVFANWSVLLILAGSALLLSSQLAGLLLSLLAILAIVFASHRLTLGFHGVIYLAAAAVATGLALFIIDVLMSSFPAAPAWTVWSCAVVALIGYAAALRIQGDEWPHRVLHSITALLAVSTATGIILFAVVILAMNRMTTAEHQLDLVRTLAVCILALALAFAGAHWQRRELAWMDYAMLILIGGKIVFSTALHHHLGYFAATIFAYALTFILLPRMVRLGQPNPSS